MELTPEFKKLAEDLAGEHGPVLGAQRASMGAERLARFTQAHALLQAQTLFAVVTVSTTPMTGYSPEALAAVREDARDVVQAARDLADVMSDLADAWAQ